MGIKDLLGRLGRRGGAVVSLADIDRFEADQQKIFSRIEHERKSRTGFGKFLKHPLQVITEKPLNTLYATVPVAAALLICGFIFLIMEYGITVLFITTMADDLVFIVVLIVIVPVAVLDFYEERRVRSLEDYLPNFFRDLAGMNDSGMPLPNAVHMVSGGEYGALTPYIRKMDSEISWNSSFVDAMWRFAERIGTPLAERSVDLISKATASGGDVGEVLRAAAKDAYDFVYLWTERRNSMMIYTVIIIVSFFVFLFVIAVLTGTFLTTMAEAGKAVASSGSAGSAFMMGGADLFTYKRMFSHCALLQGFFSGLVAGQMGEGRALAGLKFSTMMIIISWILFRFFI